MLWNEKSWLLSKYSETDRKEFDEQKPLISINPYSRFVRRLGPDDLQRAGWLAFMIEIVGGFFFLLCYLWFIALVSFDKAYGLKGAYLIAIAIVSTFMTLTLGEIVKDAFKAPMFKLLKQHKIATENLTDP